MLTSFKNFQIHGRAAIALTQILFFLTPNLYILLLSGYSTQKSHRRLQLNLFKTHHLLLPACSSSVIFYLGVWPYTHLSSNSKILGVICILLCVVLFPTITLYIHITTTTTITIIIVVAILECLLYFRYLRYIIANPHKSWRFYYIRQTS